MPPSAAARLKPVDAEPARSQRVLRTVNDRLHEPAATIVQRMDQHAAILRLAAEQTGAAGDEVAQLRGRVVCEECCVVLRGVGVRRHANIVSHLAWQVKRFCIRPGQVGCGSRILTKMRMATCACVLTKVEGTGRGSQAISPSPGGLTRGYVANGPPPRGDLCRSRYRIPPERIGPTPNDTKQQVRVLTEGFILKAERGVKRR